MYSSRITSPTPPTPQTEDIFSSALSALFTDDVQNSHGVPGSYVTYHSPRLGDVVLRIPQHPEIEEGRKLFAHYLWNAGVICADAIEEASVAKETEQNGQQNVGSNGGEEGKRTHWDRRYWDVRGKKVLELGAGTALPSIISALSGASSTTITDHPSSPAMTTGAIEQNVKVNIFERDKRKDPDANFDAETAMVAASPTLTASGHLGEVSIFGYTWGTTKFYSPSSYGKPSSLQDPSPNRIIISDCLWMPSQHTNLVKTILHYLDDSRTYNCALVVAGFHTGREIVRQFLEIATGEYKLLSFTEGEAEEVKGQDDENTHSAEVQGRLRAAEIFEIDVDGLRRSWKLVRTGETKEAAKRWCVVAVLVRR